MKSLKRITSLFIVLTFVLIPMAVSSQELTVDLQEGDLISALFSDDPDVYIINENGYKRLFLNPEIFEFYGHLGGFASVIIVTPEVRDSYITSGLFQNCETNDGKVYGVSIETEDDGTLHWVDASGEEVLVSDPDFFEKVFCINDTEFNWYPQGDPFDSADDVPGYERRGRKDYDDQQVGSGKAAICHKGRKTINISSAALPAHFAHGDEAGSCNGPTPTPSPSPTASPSPSPTPTPSPSPTPTPSPSPTPTPSPSPTPTPSPSPTPTPTNTHSTDLESTSSQSWSITDASQTGLDITGDMTVEAWVNVETAPGNNVTYAVASKYFDQGGQNERAWRFMYQNASGTNQFVVSIDQNGTDSSDIYIAATDLGSAQWHHVAFTFVASTSTVNFYVDGVSIGSQTGISTAIHDSTAPLVIGAVNIDATPVNLWDGLIDEVRIWDDTRTATEITNNYQQELVGNEANLQGYWQFDNDGTDETTNANNLTNNNVATFSTDVPF